MDGRYVLFTAYDALTRELEATAQEVAAARQVVADDTERFEQLERQLAEYRKANKGFQDALVIANTTRGMLEHDLAEARLAAVEEKYGPITDKSV
jgi:septal ring factor EnvC (AmiA/AmiB activator)